MMTVADIEYEPAQTKIFPLATQTVAALAGDMQLHAHVCPFIINSLRSNPPSGWLVNDIAERYAFEFAEYRRSLAEREYLTPLALNVETFKQEQNKMSPDLVNELANKLVNHVINSEAIIAGIDQTGPHLYKIIDPGVSYCFDTPCFASAGIGGYHAASQFMMAKFDKTWPLINTIVLAIRAKMKAEAISGVGDDTDLTVIYSGGFYQANDTDMDVIRKIVEKISDKEKAAETEAYSELEELINTVTKKNRPTNGTTGQQQVDQTGE